MIQDDSGHWYVIPSGQENKFEEWVAWIVDYEAIDGDQVDYPDFDSMRLNGGPSRLTFVDPKED